MLTLFKALQVIMFEWVTYDLDYFSEAYMHKIFALCVVRTMNVFVPYSDAEFLKGFCNKPIHNPKTVNQKLHIYVRRWTINLKWLSTLVISYTKAKYLVSTARVEKAPFYYHFCHEFHWRKILSFCIWNSLMICKWK